MDLEDDTSLKDLKLSLEKPYKDDNGNHIPTILEIQDSGQVTLEEEEDRNKALSTNVRRIFAERGLDFLDKIRGKGVGIDALHDPDSSSSSSESNEEDDSEQSADAPESSTAYSMTPQQLYKMRSEIYTQLQTALGEMDQMKQLLALILPAAAPSALTAALDQTVSATATTTQPQKTLLTAASATRPPTLPAVQLFEAQLNVGRKDEALRHAVDIFKSAAGEIERGRNRNEKYWLDALKIRKANWGMYPAPLPPGSATGRGADKTSRDFMISFGLEESPPQFKRASVAYMSDSSTKSEEDLVFPFKQDTRLRVSLLIRSPDGQIKTSYNTPTPIQSTSLQGSLLEAQREIVDREIFSVLIKQSANLPTASARVYERTIAIEAVRGVELRIENVSIDESDNFEPGPDTPRCDFIYHALHLLLLRLHLHHKLERLGNAGVVRDVPPTLLSMQQAQKQISPAVLQPIIDVLQYQVFCEQTIGELDMAVKVLTVAGVNASLKFTPVGETGKELFQLFAENSPKRWGGEAVLKIDRKYILRLTFVYPSTLTAHLIQSTLTISSIPQLRQLLVDEMESFLLNLICDVGRETSENVSSTWFVDPLSGRSIGRWEGCIINFRVSFGDEMSIQCSASRLLKVDSVHETYQPDSGKSIIQWSRDFIASALASPY